MEIQIIMASINEMSSLTCSELNLKNDDLEVIIVDEGDENIRNKNSHKLHVPLRYYGPKEREEWFKQRFGFPYKKYLSVIPQRAHAETSFGFLVAYEENPGMVIELDDDVIPAKHYDLVRSHKENLFNAGGNFVSSPCKWYNTMENLQLNINNKVFPRGHPYHPDARNQKLSWASEGTLCVLNMGLWLGQPDLDALTILYWSGLDGRCHIEGKDIKRDKVVVDKGTYFAVCSMNTAFVPKIIPAFYQLYMNLLGIDRFDDIWSGIILKRIADHLGDKVCLGKPLVYHDKRKRDTFEDLEKELEGMIINEMLWKIIDSLELHGKNYHDAYSSLIDGLKKDLDKFKHHSHRKFMDVQVRKMNLWLETIDKIR